MRIYAAASVVFCLTILSACGSDPIPVPAVEGMRLDKAHETLREAGFEKTDDVDIIEERNPMLRGNWVVVEQDPTGGESVDSGTEIKLGIAKPEDSGVLERLPEGSPVRIEIEEREAERVRQEAERQAREAERAREVERENAQATEDFVNAIDPRARIAQNLLAELSNFGTNIEGYGSVPAVASSSLRSINRSLGLYSDAFDAAPGHLDDDVDTIKQALEDLQRSSDTLLSAQGAAAQGSIERFWGIYRPALEKYNEALSSIYSTTSVPAPTA